MSDPAPKGNISVTVPAIILTWVPGSAAGIPPSGPTQAQVVFNDGAADPDDPAGGTLFDNLRKKWFPLNEPSMDLKLEEPESPVS